MQKLIYKIIIVAAAILTLGSCSMYREYERPKLHYLDSLYRRLPDLQDSSSIAELSWREFFADTTLQEWIRLGISFNTDLSIARFKVDQAQATLHAARRAFFPSASLSAEAGINGGSMSYSLTPSFSWEADIFGKMTNAKRSAAAAVEQSVAYKQAVQTQLIATIAETYYTLLMLDAQLAVSQRTQKTWEENIRTLEALKMAGKTNEAAVLQAKANMLDVQNSIYLLHKKIFETENAFSSLIGIVPIIIDRGTLDGQEFIEHLSGGLPAEILGNRPDVRQAELQLKQAYYATNQARASFYPSVKLDGFLRFDPSGFITDLGASLLQPLYARGLNKAQLRKAEAQQKIALYEFRQKLLDAGIEVNNALVALKTAQSMVKIDKKQIVHLQAAVWNTQLLMKHGNTNYLEVLTAQQKLLQAELSEISDRYEEIRSVINLYHALGGGYKKDGE
ncbi:MAG: efflux transporter outer membrane subunit [Bacteroidales bacterium]|nr:efflux transporter outer membrane subunit [Bacteroidales bacterium]